ncbi:copper chaperone PCu(A)C [Thetidibacter halocola]|uniref:Copper chaperone PCu(A)C n=1 Tax=Thetidibacter halocola TaxID=2827239 RepID=A0A8J8B8C4_9RHOB|nr:copper chaperone PCu(A)C [Thetidibacter halocola]MBS0124609.1 copper chaperone PCu(A)C [Thetidibacter halocola]
MKKILLAGAAALALAVPAMADVTIEDAYARSAMPGAPSGAAFMVIANTGAEDDRLVEARSDIAARVELHTHMDMGGGVMKMTEVEEGFVIPAGGSHALARGGDHVMFMGLKQPLVQGEAVTVTLVFEKAGEMVVEIPVDLERQDGHGGIMQKGHGMLKSGS